MYDHDAFGRRLDIEGGTCKICNIMMYNAKRIEKIDDTCSKYSIHTCEMLDLEAVTGCWWRYAIGTLTCEPLHDIERHHDFKLVSILHRFRLTISYPYQVNTY